MATVTTEPSSLARYVPRLSAEWDMHSSDPWREIEGTLCYIDISGFTALSEKLARRGRIGAEELTEVLNYVFGRMLGISYDRGGALLKFGGDALLLVFRGPDHPIQACSAAVEMQGALREASNYQTSAGRLRLRMSVGLHSGTIHLFRVGESHKELILTGPAASATTEMEETAVAGEILISSATRAALPVGSATKQKGDGWLLNWRKARLECCGWSPRVDLEPDAIVSGIPLALRDYLQYGAAEPEHRIATVGFIKYEGVDHLMERGGPEAVAAALDELIRTVQSAVDEEGVTFLASDIDQDGGKVILVGGVPGAQEDDEGRVLRAVRRITDRAGTLPLKVGVNQGHVFVGEIGTDFRATYTIMGDTVNLAARLMAAASPGEVYAGPAVLDRSLTLFETTALEPFHVKGKEHPVQAYAMGARTGRRPKEHKADLPFAGRTEELTMLHSMVEGLFAGTGDAVAIIGERGVGKSRLVDEILPSLERAEHIDIRAEPYGIGTPYRPLRDPVRRLLGVERGSQATMARQLEAGVAALDSDFLPLLPLLADVAMVEVPTTPEVDVIEPRFRPDRTADLVVEVLARSFTGPVFFEVEDGHYMDEASTHVMMRIATAVTERPWFVLTTRRDTPDGFHPGEREIHLGPLSDDEARDLVIAATEAAPLRPHEVDAIVRRSGGLPLFLEEIVRAVRQAGGVEDLPDSLDAIVSSQIDALSPLARRLLRYASVLGRSFRVAVLNELLAEEQIGLDSATRGQLEGFLDPDGPDRLRFRHGMMRDVAYQGLSFKRRRELHLRAGLAAERAAGDHPETAADVLALHFSIAQEHERTWLYAVIAGDQARDAYANIDAAAHYQRALESARRLPNVEDAERARVWISLGDVSERAGLFDQSLNAYRRASKAVPDDAELQIDLVLRRSIVCRLKGDHVAALRETTRGLRLLDGEGMPNEPGARARITAERAAIRRRQERPEETLVEARRAERDARAEGELKALGHALELLDWAHWMLGKTELAVNSSEAVSVLEEAGDLQGVSEVLNNMGAYAYWEGRWSDAIEAYEKSRAAEHRMGNDVQAAIVAANIAELLINQNRLEEAQPLITNAVRVLKASKNHALTFAENELARLLIRRGEFEDAETLLGALQERSLAAGEKMSSFNAVIQLADLRLREGKPAEALEVLDEAGETGAAMEILGASVGHVRARALSALGHHEEALDAVDAGLAQARKQGLLFDEAVLLDDRNEIISRAGGEPDLRDLETADRLFGGMDIRREPVLAV